MDTQSHILLTGGTGFFGKALLRHWVKQEQGGGDVPRITVLSRNPDLFAGQYPMLVNHAWLCMAQGDICDANTLPRDMPFTHILHAAADSTTGPLLSPQQRFDQIVGGTRNLLDLALACGSPRFLLTSSGGVYGAQPSSIEQIPEDCHTLPDPLNAANAYSLGKRIAEHLCALYMQAHNLPIVVARCFTFVGQDLPLGAHFAIGNFIRDALHAESITVQGDGSPLRSYMDQRELAQWLVAILMRGQFGHAYNVGSDRAISVLELAHTVRDLLAPHKPVRVMGASNMTTPRNCYIPCVEKAKTDLGLRITIPLDDAILFAANTHRTGDLR